MDQRLKMKKLPRMIRGPLIENERMLKMVLKKMRILENANGDGREGLDNICTACQLPLLQRWQVVK